MKMRLVLIMLFQCAFAQAFADVIKLADASASASVESIADPKGFKITVAFHPVTTLDEISNCEMTETMAQFYAEEALSVFLRSQKAISFDSIKGTTTTQSGGKVGFIFSVPIEHVIDAPPKTVELRVEIVSGWRGKETGVGVKTRLWDFRSSCFRDLRVAEALFAESADAVKGEREQKELAQKIKKAFAALRRKIKADENLFRAEKAELLEKADKIEGYLLEKIGARSNPQNTIREEEAAVLIVGANFKEPFGALLKADPILLTHGGARLIEMGDGKVAILSVGSALANNEDKEDIAELQASAALGKLLGGEETRVQGFRERNYRRNSGNSGTSEDLEVKRTSTTQISSIDFHKSGETVGTWFSPDGKKFFMAKGRIVRQKKRR